jgi:xanthine phosphoribosyltransferase
MLPKVHYATAYAKPLCRPIVDTSITEVSHDAGSTSPGIGIAFQSPIAKGR